MADSFLVLTPLIQGVIKPSGTGINNRHFFAKKQFSERDLNKRTIFNFDKDVIVFLHIQKTGGTNFGKHLVGNLKLESPCKCVMSQRRCQCFTKNGKMWLFGNAFTGWGCGLHADWTELIPCVDGVLNKKERQHRHRRFVYEEVVDFQ